jgi:hypothetical protein
MGIRNLAYCLVRHKADKSWTITHWNNIDLLEGGIASQDSKKCSACTSPAAWIHTGDSSRWCKGCATGVRRKKTATLRPTLPCLPCGLTVKPLRELALTGDWPNAKKAKKEDLTAMAASRYLMPWKPAKATDSSLMTILRAMDTWLDTVLPTFASATLIRLENQPVMKGPTMKSVQMILFTLLSHRLVREHAWTGSIEFVHAGTKTRAAEATAAAAVPATAVPANVIVSTVPVVATTKEEGAAYRARKKTAEAEAVEVLTKAGASAAAWLAFFNGKSKKSDLADALLMALRA